jgi:hypothetical protein
MRLEFRNDVYTGVLLQGKDRRCLVNIALASHPRRTWAGITRNYGNLYFRVWLGNIDFFIRNKRWFR